jgi:hypothetical protein
MQLPSPEAYLKYFIWENIEIEMRLQRFPVSGVPSQAQRGKKRPTEPPVFPATTMV